MGLPRLSVAWGRGSGCPDYLPAAKLRTSRWQHAFFAHGITALCLIAIIAIAGLCRAHGALVGGTLIISGPNCRFPDAAYGNVSRQFLVVWADYSPPQLHIFGALVSGNGAYSTPFLISDGGLGGLFPAVAFNSASNEFLVTWDDDGNHGGVIYGRRVRGSDGTLIGGVLPIGTIYGGARSAVAWSPASACYLVVFWAPGPGNLPSEIYGQRVSGTGPMLGTNVNISNDSVFSGYPAVAWGAAGDQFLVTWDNDDGNIHGQRVDAASGTPLGGQLVVTSGGAKDRSSIAYDAVNSRWLVQYNDGANAGYSYDQFAQFVNADGSLGADPLPMAHTPAFEGDTQSGGDIAFESGARRYFSSFGTDNGESGQESLASGAQLGGQVVLGTGYYTSMCNAADTDTHRFLTAWEGMFARSYQVFCQLYAASLGAPANFTAIPANIQNQLTWRNPTDPHFAATMIRVKTTGLPSSPTDGILVVDKAGAAGGLDSFIHAPLSNWTTYYYAAFAHDNGTNYSSMASAVAMPRPPASTLSFSDFSAGTDGWALDVWRAGMLGFGTVSWDAAAGDVVSGGSGEINNNDPCTREGSTLTRLISTAGYTNIQIEYDVTASLFAPPGGPPTGACSPIEGTLEDKLVLYYSTTGTNGPWTVAQTLAEGVELPTNWRHEYVNLSGLSGVADNSNFALRFQWQFNNVADTGRVDNVRVVSGPVTAPIPVIGVAPLALEHFVPQGRTLTSDVIKVSNTGEGILSFTVSNNNTWLGVTAGTGVSSGPERAVTLNYNLAALPVADYVAGLQITSSNAFNGPVNLPVTVHVLPPACVWEPFDYYDGNLTIMGAANWAGSAADSMLIDGGRLKINGGSGTVDALRSTPCLGSNNIVAAGIKICGGGGTGDIFWSIYLDDSASNNLARWYGSSQIARGRIGGSITADMPLSGPDIWDDLYLEIDIATGTSEFFFNGVSFGKLSPTTPPASGVSNIRIERIDRPTTSADSVSFDQFSIGSVELTYPQLSFARSGSQLALLWQAARRGAVLETTSLLASPGSWTSIPNPPITKGQFAYYASTEGTSHYFRLRRN